MNTSNAEKVCPYLHERSESVYNTTHRIIICDKHCLDNRYIQHDFKTDGERTNVLNNFCKGDYRQCNYFKKIEEEKGMSNECIAEQEEGQTMLAGVTETVEVSAELKEAIQLHQHIYESAITVANALMEMCRSLKTMRDKQLYKLLGYADFKTYVENNGDYSFKERQAYNYIKTYEQLGEGFLQSNANIGITKLEVLTVLGREDRQELVQEHDLCGMTVEEVKALVKEKQALGEQLSFLTAEIEEIKENNSTAELTEKISELEKKLAEAEKLGRTANSRSSELANKIKSKESEIAMLEEEISMMKEKPVEVAVREPSEDELNKLRSEVSAQLEEKHRQEIKDLEEKHKKSLAAEQNKAQELEKKIKTASPDEKRIALKLYFKETQKSVTAFVDMVKGLEDDTERRKFIGGAVKWLEGIADDLEGMR